MTEVVTISLLAGLLAIDDRAGWQSLFAEPVFSSILVGIMTGQLDAALRCGVLLQLVWLSIGAARGTRHPNGVVGGLVGAGAACIVLLRTADTHVDVVVVCAAFCGLLAGEAGAAISRVAGEYRERWLANFRLPDDPVAASRDLLLTVAGSAAFVGGVAALSTLVMLPVATAVTEALSGRMAAAGDAAGWWMAAVSAFAVATVVRAFLNRALARYALLGALVAVGLSWLA